MKKIICNIVLLCCISLMLLPTLVLGADSPQEFDTSVEFKRALTSTDYDFKYDNLGINWKWTCKFEGAYAEVQPMRSNLIYFWKAEGDPAVCYANLDNTYCIRWVNLNESPKTWRFQFTAYDNNDNYISGPTRLLSEE